MGWFNAIISFHTVDVDDVSIRPQCGDQAFNWIVSIHRSLLVQC